jgi:hypothetical protein
MGNREIEAVVIGRHAYRPVMHTTKSLALYSYIPQREPRQLNNFSRPSSVSSSNAYSRTAMRIPQYNSHKNGIHTIYQKQVTKYLIQCSRILLEKLTVTHLVRKFPPTVESEGSLACSQWPTTGPYPMPDESSPQNGSGAHPTSYQMSTRGSFPGDKAAGA